jgi:hypothetical protein
LVRRRLDRQEKSAAKRAPKKGRSADVSVTLNTARYHVKQLFAKLDAHDRAEVIARVLDGHTSRY